MKDYAGEKFLDKLYSNLYMSDEVQHTKENTDKRHEAIRKYLERLQRVHSKEDTESKKELLRSLYYDKYIIKEDILREKIKQFNIHIDEQGLQEEINIIINSQKKSLDKWLDYLTNDTTHYPLWAKYWVFQGMLKMGNYDEGIEGYQKRSKDTEGPFVDANPEIIAKAISLIEKQVKKQEINDEELEKLVNSGNFSKIYAILEKRYKENIIEYSSNEGKWVKYNQGSKEDAIKLCDSLQDKNTHWCTADELMAIRQLCGPYVRRRGGDFYVYYTKDKKGKYTLPRIAMRMDDHDSIGEVRGILDGQNLEESMIPILEKQLNKMNFLSEEAKKDTFEKIEGLKELTRIYKKTAQKEVLTQEELENIYTKKYGFGWTQDPRVEKTIRKRDVLKDFNRTENREVRKSIIDCEQLPYDCINDKEVILDLMKDCISVLKYASEEIKNDKEFMFEMIKIDSKSFKYISNELKHDRDFILKSVKQDGYTLEYVPIIFLDDKEIVLEAVKNKGATFKFASKKLKANKEVVLEAVKSYGCAINWVSENLKSDKDVVLEAVKQDGSALMYVSKEFKDNKDIVMLATEGNYFSLDNASDRLKDDKEVILKAIQKNGMAIQYASKRLKSDKEVVMEAVKNRGAALQYASEELKDDKEVVLTAISNDTLAISFASDELENDKEVVQEAINKNAASIKFVSKEFKNDKKLAMKVITSAPYTYKFISEELKNDREFILSALKINGEILNYLSDKLKDDKEIVLEAVKNYGYALKYASERLRKDKKVALTASKGKAFSLNCASDVLANDKKFVLEILNEAAYNYCYVSDKLKDDEEVTRYALIRNPYMLKYASERLKNDRNFILNVAKETFVDISCVSEKLKKDEEFVSKIQEINKEQKHITQEIEKPKKFSLKLFKSNDLSNKKSKSNNQDLGFIDIFSITTLVMALGTMVLVIIKIINK